jgi:hypothetical protein
MRWSVLVAFLTFAPSLPAQATSLSPPTSQVVLGQVPDSIKMRMLAAVVRGDIAGAISLYQLHTGREAVPRALQALQAAFNVSNQIAGRCHQVAKEIHQGLTFLGGKAEYLRISSTAGEILSWRGRVLVSNNNLHVAVRHGDRLYDAFTGPAGMVEAEYVAAMMHKGELLLSVVTAP